MLLLFSACATKTETADGLINVKELPSVRPDRLWAMESVDTLYFGHLGYESVSLGDGSLLAYDRHSRVLMHLGPGGRLRGQLTRPGRGPGEVGDILNLVKTPSGGALFYDQDNQKAVRIDATPSFQTEFPVTPLEGRTPSAIWPGATDSTYLVQMRSGMSSMLDHPMADIRMYLVPYNEESESYGRVQEMLAYTFVPHMLNGNFAGGMRVPNAPATLLAYRPDSGTYYLHLSGSGELAEVNASLDTLRTVPLNLPREELGRAERDSLLKANERIGEDVLLEKLPEEKVPVEKLLAGPDGEIWLKLNYAGSTNQWLVMSREGEALYTLHLPAGSMLLHASRHNLAVRLDDVTLALYRGPASYREEL